MLKLAHKKVKNKSKNAQKYAKKTLKKLQNQKKIGTAWKKKSTGLSSTFPNETDKKLFFYFAVYH